MRLFLNPATLAWIFLLAATGVSGVLAETHHGVPWAALLICCMAGFKVDVIMWHFMELKDGPVFWRITMRSWIVLVVCLMASGFISFLDV